MNKFVFLDRDGVINKKIVNGYVTNFNEFIFNEGVLQALEIFNKNDFKVIIITNQQCIGKKILNLDGLGRIHQKMIEQIEIAGGKISDIFFCPHLGSDNCSCRKPKPGMLFEAARKHNIHLDKTFFVGDSLTDIQAGKAAGTKTILLNGIGAPEISDKSTDADATFANLSEAIDYIISNS